MSETLRQAGGRWVLTYERRLAHPPEKVWRAITEPEHLEHWFPARIDGERRLGAKLTFVFPGELMQGEHTGVVQAFDPPRLLEFTWNGEVLRFELEPDGQHCLLRFHYTFAERGLATRNGAGWHLCLKNLEDRLRGAAKDPMNSEGWARLYGEYTQRFGLGEFPAFLVAAGAGSGTADPGAATAYAAHTPGLVCTAFGGGASTLLLCHAPLDAGTAEHVDGGDTYLLVVEGRYEVSFRGDTLTLGAGMEFHVPQGLRYAGRVAAGTRMIVGLGKG